MVTADEIFAPPRARVRADARPTEPRGSAPAELFLVDGGPATVGRDRLGDPAVLRRLRPGPAHRRRPGPQLPVRPRGVRPARARCARAPPTRRSPSAGWSRCAASAPGTASTTRRSCSPTGRCPPSAAEPGYRACLGCGHDVLEEPRAPRKSPSVTPGARRRPARSCAGRACAAWGCSRAAPRRRAPGSPWRSRRSSVGVAHGVLHGSHGPEMDGAGQPRGKPSGTAANWDGGDPARAEDSVTRRRVKSNMVRARRVRRIRPDGSSGRP